MWSADMVLCEPERGQVLVFEDLARMDRGVKGIDHGGSSFRSVVVSDLHVSCSCASPAEGDAPLVVDPDAVVAGPVSKELLQRLVSRGGKTSGRPAGVAYLEWSECRRSWT